MRDFGATPVSVFDCMGKRTTMQKGMRKARTQVMSNSDWRYSTALSLVSIIWSPSSQSAAAMLRANIIRMAAGTYHFAL